MAHVARNLHSVDVCHHHFGRIAQDNFFVVLFFFIDAFVENDVGIVDGPVADALVSSADSFGEGFDLFWREDGVGIRGDAEHGDVTVGERVDVVDDRFCTSNGSSLNLSSPKMVISDGRLDSVKKVLKPSRERMPPGVNNVHI